MKNDKKRVKQEQIRKKKNMACQLVKQVKYFRKKGGLEN